MIYLGFMDPRWLFGMSVINSMICHKRELLGGGFKHFLFSSLFGEDSHFD